jgi:anaerobic magnesium-protoporphyrin IX monomethyl ester cyclase
VQIAFIRPMATFNRYIQNVPLNYIHLAAYLREQGHTPHILDMVFDDVTPAAVDSHLREHGISVVGIGCMTCEFPAAVAEARRLKQIHPNMRIVFGGAHPSGDPEECLKTGVVDYVIAGEGEIALDRLLAALETGRTAEGIRGVWRREGEQIRSNVPADVPDIETLPAPAYDLLPLERYFQLDSPWHFPKSPRAVQFISSRGCPYRCSYCHTIHGKKYRGLSSSKVLDQIENLVRVGGVREFMMVDDIFNFDLERAKEICRGIVSRKLQVHLQFPNGVRGDRFDEELVALMKESGTHFMAIAIETVSERFQKLVRKNLKIDKALQTIHWANKYRIEVCGFFMIGFPGETIEEVGRTIEFAVKAPLDAIFISLVSPFKGTVMRNDMIEGRFGEMDAEGFVALDQLFPTVHNKTLPTETLTKMQRAAYWRFYTKPRSVLNLGRKFTHVRNVKKIARAVTRRMRHAETVSVN